MEKHTNTNKKLIVDEEDTAAPKDMVEMLKDESNHV